MITYQFRGKKVRAIVRRKGIGSKSMSFPTKGLAKTWAERIEREFAEREARGEDYLEDMTLAELIDWHDLESRRAKSTITLTQRGNLTRLCEGLGHIAVGKLRPMDIVEHVKRRVYGQHQRGDGILIPPCTPATMRVEIGYLADLLALGQASEKVRMNPNPVPDARIVLRNTRNGRNRKTLKGEFGVLPIEVPRDRHGRFEPQIVPKHQTRWTGFDERILSLYARGMTVREIQAHLQEMYGAEVSPSLISSVTDAIVDEVKIWQGRPLDAVYPIVYLDCIHVKVREGAVRVKAVYLAMPRSP